MKEKIKNFASKFYTDKDIFHDFFHAEQILKKAMEINQKYNVNKKILRAGAYFHGAIKEHEKEIIIFLKNNNYLANEINEIISVAKESHTLSNPKTLAGKILHDAHILAGGKEFLLIKTFSIGALNGRNLKDSAKYFLENIEKINCVLPECKKEFAKVKKISKRFAKKLLA